MEPIEFTDHKYGVEIAISDIHVDLAVQRAIVPQRLLKLTGAFDAVLIGELLVSERSDGKLYVLDGQHRKEAAAANGVTAVACEVFSGLSRADEARLFMGRNDRAGIARVDRDRNLATSGDQDTLDVQMAAQSAGFVFVASGSEESTFRDRAAGVSIMRSAAGRKGVEITGPEHLSHVFTLYARIYGNKERPESVLLKALSRILLKSEVDEDRLYERLRGLPPQQLVQLAAQLKAELSVVKGISTVGAAVQRIAEQYNRGLPNDSAKRIRI